jgi:hypothetical protein
MLTFGVTSNDEMCHDRGLLSHDDARAAAPVPDCWRRHRTHLSLVASSGQREVLARWRGRDSRPLMGAFCRRLVALTGGSRLRRRAKDALSRPSSATTTPEQADFRQIVESKTLSGTLESGQGRSERPNCMR